MGYFTYFTLFRLFTLWAILNNVHVTYLACSHSKIYIVHTCLHLTYKQRRPGQKQLFICSKNNPVKSKKCLKSVKIPLSKNLISNFTSCCQKTVCVTKRKPSVSHPTFWCFFQLCYSHLS